jgi:hypothetical protein
MTMDIQITVEAGIIRVVYRGEVQFDATTDMLGKVGRIASENRCTRLLFDVREASDRDYHISAIRHAEHASALGIEQTFRIAVLGVQGDQMLPYIDEPEALAWLRGAP